MGLIQFPQCTPQPLTIDGTCQHTDYQRRFTGRLSSAAPFVILSLRKCGAAYHYLKHPSMGALDVAITLSQMPLPQADHCQHTFALADAVHLGTQSTGRVVLSGTLPLTFSAGQLFPFVVDTQQQPFLCLLAFAQKDITLKHHGRWVVPPRLLAPLAASWGQVLSTTRQGVIRLTSDGGGPGGYCADRRAPSSGGDPGSMQSFHHDTHGWLLAY